MNWNKCFKQKSMIRKTKYTIIGFAAELIDIRSVVPKEECLLRLNHSNDTPLPFEIFQSAGDCCVF